MFREFGISPGFFEDSGCVHEQGVPASRLKSEREFLFSEIPRVITLLLGSRDTNVFSVRAQKACDSFISRFRTTYQRISLS